MQGKLCGLLMCLCLFLESQGQSENEQIFMLSQVQNNRQGIQFTPAGKEATSMRAN